jgi:hypothetical protein
VASFFLGIWVIDLLETALVSKFSQLSRQEIQATTISGIYTGKLRWGNRILSIAGFFLGGLDFY